MEQGATSLRVSFRVGSEPGVRLGVSKPLCAGKAGGCRTAWSSSPASTRRLGVAMAHTDANLGGVCRVPRAVPGIEGCHFT